MWSFYVEFLDELGAKLESIVVSASNKFHAMDMAELRATSLDYAEVTATRL